MNEKAEPVTGRAGEDIKAGEKIVLVADGLWYRQHAVREPVAVKPKPKPKRRR